MTEEADPPNTTSQELVADTMERGGTTPAESEKSAPQDEDGNGGEHVPKTRLDRLRDTFELMDVDHSGTIDVNELRVVLNMHVDKDFSDDDIVMVINELIPGKGLEQKKKTEIHLDFDDFVTIMYHFRDGDAEEGFVNRLLQAQSKSSFKQPGGSQFGFGALLRRGMSAMMISDRPDEFLNSKKESERTLFGFSGLHNARIALGRRVNSTPIQALVVILVLADAFCVLMEVIADTIHCEEPHECDDHPTGDLGVVCHEFEHVCHKLHTIEFRLRWISISILIFFMVQIVLLMIALGLTFWKEIFYVADFLVVAIALVLETAVPVEGGGVIVLLLVWRMLRIVHALATTVDVHQFTVQKRVLVTKSKEAKLAQDMRDAILKHQSRGANVMNRIRNDEDQNNLDDMTQDQLVDLYRDHQTHTREVEQRYLELQQTLKAFQAKMELTTEEFEETNRRFRKPV